MFNTDIDMDKDKLEKYVHQENVKVYNGLLEFAVYNMLATASFRDVIRAATRAANDADKSVVDYLAEFAIYDADIMDDGVIDCDWRVACHVVSVYAWGAQYYCWLVTSGRVVRLGGVRGVTGE